MSRYVEFDWCVKEYETVLTQKESQPWHMEGS
jgi:hypothetical protein